MGVGVGAPLAPTPTPISKQSNLIGPRCMFTIWDLVGESASQPPATMFTGAT